ncbi:MAG: hypothetical protein JW768_14770 [Chitinispirillaceae bacterium]|nr:hypothetical protein [Chitinispirillaceae bacterium]
MDAKPVPAMHKVVFLSLFFTAVFPLRLSALQHYVTASYCYTSKGVLIANMEIECDSMVVDGEMEREIRDMLRTLLEKHKGIKKHLRFKCMISSANIMENVTFLNKETEQLFKRYAILQEIRSELTRFPGSTVTFSFKYDRKIRKKSW